MIESAFRSITSAQRQRRRMDESAPQHVHAEFARGCRDQRWPVQLLHFQSSWVYRFGRCSRIHSPNSDGRTDKAQWKDYWFSAEVLTAKQVAETLAEATGHKFTAAVRNAESFQNDAAQPSSIFEPACAKGGLEFFRYVDDGRMAYVGSVKDDTQNILGREPLLLREWAKLHANELLEIAGS
jgi:hypothetical protein